jgi:hypothetical protein
VDTVLGAPAIEAGETALIERARRGDRDAFADLVDGRLAATFRTALAILGNESDARDATQDIFLRVWRNLPELREPDRFAQRRDRPVGNESTAPLLSLEPLVAAGEAGFGEDQFAQQAHRPLTLEVVDGRLQLLCVIDSIFIDPAQHGAAKCIDCGAQGL